MRLVLYSFITTSLFNSILSSAQNQKTTSPKYELKEISTTVEKRPTSTVTTDSWSVFNDEHMTKAIFKVQSGDTVTIIGWSPWQYAIKSKSGDGYVSYKALLPVGKMDSINWVIEKRSPAEEDISMNTFDPLDTLKPLAHLSVTAPKNTYYQGECFPITVAFNVADQNRVGIQFRELGMQVTSWVSQELNISKSWTSNAGIDDIIGVEKQIKGKGYTEYRILQLFVCAGEATEVIVPPLKIEMAKWSRSAPKQEMGILTFFSDTLKIKLKKLPAGAAVTSAKYYKMVGEYTLEDTLYKDGTHLRYKIFLDGNGLTYPAPAPDLKLPGVKFVFQDVQYNDTLNAESIHSLKVFTYELQFTKPGPVDFSKAYRFDFFDPRKGKVISLRSSLVKTVKAKEVALHSEKMEDGFPSYKKYIAIDVSQSMQIEDYLPYRLSAVTNALDRFISARKACDIGIILFAGDAVYFNYKDKNGCYTSKNIKSIAQVDMRKGTAIGGAIWTATNFLDKSQSGGTLVVIGDGDNTAGHINPQSAADIAKLNGLKVYSIGVGRKGLVPYGEDEQGNKHMVDNTFNDSDFKLVSAATGGKYFYAKDEEAIFESLKLIFP